MGTRMIVGDTRDVVKSLPDHSVDLVFSSPPFLGLRAYIADGHENKNREIGAESTPAEFLGTQLALAEEYARILTRTGSLVMEFGDTAAGSGGAGGDYGKDGLREGQNRFVGSAKTRRNGEYVTRDDVPRSSRTALRKGKGDEWPKDKSLCLIPHLYAASLAYGRNLLRTGITAAEMLNVLDGWVAEGIAADEAIRMAHEWLPQATEVGDRTFDSWRIRNVATWCRTNPPVGREGDKFRRATSLITIACKAADRWFDVDAVRRTDGPGDNKTRRSSLNRDGVGYRTGDDNELMVLDNPLGPPPLDWWVISPSGYRGAHFAVMAEEVAMIPIESMCPRRVCRWCGEPSRRIVENERLMDGEIAELGAIGGTERKGEGASGTGHWRKETRRTLIGWSSCSCPGTEQGELWEPGWMSVMDEIDGQIKAARQRIASKADKQRIRAQVLPALYDRLAAMYRGRPDGMHAGPGWRPGIVLDPFGGSGTTAKVATARGRDAILIDFDENNVKLVRDRLGMFLDEVVHHGAAAVQG